MQLVDTMSYLDLNTSMIIWCNVVVKVSGHYFRCTVLVHCAKIVDILRFLPRNLNCVRTDANYSWFKFSIIFAYSYIG